MASETNIVSVPPVTINLAGIGTPGGFIAGPKGEKGDKGDKGAQGIQGPVGLTGAQGPAGESGPSEVIVSSEPPPEALPEGTLFYIYETDA